MADPTRLLAAFQDPSVSELIVNGDGSVYVDRAAQGISLERLPWTAEEADLASFVDAVTGAAQNLGPWRPYADLSALDGSRVHVIAAPLARGLSATIRKRPKTRPSLDALVRNGTLPEACADFLAFAVRMKRNILFVGGAGSGKTTLLNALAFQFPANERIIVLEDTAELALPQPHVVYLKTRLRDPQGQPDVVLRDLLVNTLRMRPDRIIVGEVRGTEAADLMEAMNVGHEGVLCTVHANSCREALLRLETLILLSGVNMPLRAVRANMSLAVDLIVFVAKLSDGSRKVAQVAEVTGIDVESITLADLFVFDPRRASELSPTGAIPRFYDELRRTGMEPPVEYFQR